MEEVLLNDVIHDIKSDIFNKKGKPYLSIVISKFLNEAIVKSNFIVPRGYTTHAMETKELEGLKCVVSLDLESMDYRLLDFDITNFQ